MDRQTSSRDKVLEWSAVFSLATRRNQNTKNGRNDRQIADRVMRASSTGNNLRRPASSSIQRCDVDEHGNAIGGGGLTAMLEDRTF